MTYLDHAATTPMHPEVVRALAGASDGEFGNPSSLHAPGRRARRLVEDSRDRIATALGAVAADVRLTSGGTEADNLAVKGLWWARSGLRDSAQGAASRRDVVLVSAIEHSAALEPARWLTTQGAQVIELPVDPFGRLDIDAYTRELTRHGDRIALISVMWANNEIGTVQPIREAVELAAKYGIPVHSDAVQAVGHVPVGFDASGLAAMSISAHKLGGPMGVGALVVRRGVSVVPTAHGGGQEGGARSGTVNVLGSFGLAEALDRAVGNLAQESVRLAGYRDALVAGAQQTVDAVEAQGAVRLFPEGAGADAAVPHIVALTIGGCDSEALLYLLDSHGVACSAGSACAAGVTRPSHVLSACGVDESQARGTLRFSFGWSSSAGDVDRVLEVLPEVVERARAAYRS